MLEKEAQYFFLFGWGRVTTMACQLLVISSGSPTSAVHGWIPGVANAQGATSKFHCAGHQEKPHVCVYINTYDTYV